MGRKDKSLRRGPFSAADVESALKLDGWTCSAGGKHVVYRHATKRGKVTVSRTWTGLKTWDPILKGLVRTMEVDKGTLLALLNGRKPEP